MIVLQHNPLLPSFCLHTLKFCNEFCAAHAEYDLHFSPELHDEPEKYSNKASGSKTSTFFTFKKVNYSEEHSKPLKSYFMKQNRVHSLLKLTIT